MAIKITYHNKNLKILHAQKVWLFKLFYNYRHTFSAKILFQANNSLKK